MNDAQIAMMIVKESLAFIRSMASITAKLVMEAAKGISQTSKEGIKAIGNKVKTERGNKPGEVSLEKLEKNHDNKTVYKNIDEVNLDKFKEAAKINNLQYAVIKNPDNTVNIHYAEKHTNKMEATMETVVRSVAVEKNEKVIADNEIKIAKSIKNNENSIKTSENYLNNIKNGRADV